MTITCKVPPEVITGDAMTEKLSIVNHELMMMMMI